LKKSNNKRLIMGPKTSNTNSSNKSNSIIRSKETPPDSSAITIMKMGHQGKRMERKASKTLSLKRSITSMKTKNSMKITIMSDNRSMSKK
jgi:hypothetical protein